MKTHHFAILVLFISFLTTFVYSQNYDSSKYKFVEPIYYDLDSNIINVERESTLFNGYLVIRFSLESINMSSDDKEFVEIDEYFVNDLDELNNLPSKFYIMPYSIFYIMYLHQDQIEGPIDTNVITREDLKLWKSKEFLGFRNLYYKYYGFPNRKELFLENRFNTSIFDDSSVVFLNYNQIDSIGYFIFKCSFSTAVLSYKSFYVIGKDEKDELIKKHLGFIKVLLPISQAYYFEPIGKEEYLQKGFKKAKWFPDILYRK